MAPASTYSRRDSGPRQGALPAWWHDKLLLAILGVGVLARLVFLLVGAKAYYGASQMYINGDSFSYTLGFKNLVEHGTYSFNLSEPDAAFGRLPGYPFFYGLHYLLFGEAHAVQAVAWTQTLLDCISIGLIFSIARKLAAPKNYLAPYVAAALYALYPFVIVWTTIIGTELLATFLVLLWLHTLLSAGRPAWYYVLLGLEIVLLFYVREFLGIVLPITWLYLLFSRRDKWALALRNCVLVGVGFGMLYLAWPVRNYVFQHRIMLVKPERAGYTNYKTDMVGFLNWVHSWTNESTYWLEQVLHNPQPAFPVTIFASPQEQALAQALAQQANECGSSFIVYRKSAPLPTYPQPHTYPANSGDCNEQVAVGFEQLRQSFKQRHPVVYYTKVPLENLSKVFFKSGTQSGDGVTKKQLLMGALFGYRTLLLLLGVVGLLVYRRVAGIHPILVVWVFIVGFMCWYFRQLEMRYLLQADVLLLLPAALLVGRWLGRFINAQRLGIAAA